MRTDDLLSPLLASITNNVEAQALIKTLFYRAPMYSLTSEKCSACNGTGRIVYGEKQPAEMINREYGGGSVVHIAFKPERWVQVDRRCPTCKGSGIMYKKILLDRRHILVRPFHFLANCNWEDAPELGRAILRLLSDAETDAALGTLDDSGYAPLHIAARKVNVAYARVILENGGDPMVRDFYGGTPLYHILNALVGYISCPRLYCRPGGEWEQKQQTLLCLLLNAGANPMEKDPRGRMPLNVAIEQSGPTLALPLLQAGADPMAKDAQGRTPLNLAIKYKKEEVVLALLQAGADPMAKDAYGRTPLHFAIMYNEEEVVLALLQAGADPMAKDAQGRTPLAVAAKYAHVNIVRELLQRGIQANGISPWRVFPTEPSYWENPDPRVASRWAETVFLLLGHGAPLDTQQANSQGATLLHLAAKANHIELITSLVMAGATLSSTDARGFLPFDYALQSKDRRTCNYLRQRTGSQTIREARQKRRNASLILMKKRAAVYFQHYFQHLKKMIWAAPGRIASTAIRLLLQLLIRLAFILLFLLTAIIGIGLVIFAYGFMFSL